MKLLFTYLITLTTIFLNGLCEDSLCTEEGPCYCVMKNKSRIDLSEVGLVNKARFSDVPYIENGTTQPNIMLFSYNPCYPFTELNTVSLTVPKEVQCVDAAACKVTPGSEDGTPSEIHAIGMQNTAKFYQKNETIYIVYTVSHSENNLTVALVCDEHVNYHLAVNHAGPTIHNMTLRSKCACPDKCKDVTPHDPVKHGLSTGSVLLIIFFTTLAIYFATGMTYNFCNGARGTEMLPNIGFWNDLPQLIIDGFLYTCSCFSRRTQSSYSDL